MKKSDWILAVVILAAAVLIFLVQAARDSEGEKEVTVTVDGEIFGTYSLSEDQTIKINGTNRFVIENGTVKMDWADCPDQICVNHREISRDGESIICLPNHVVLAVEGGKSADLDGIVR